MVIAAIHVFWDLPILVVAISLVYSATRHEQWRFIVQHAVVWTIYILTFLGVTCGLLYMVAHDVHRYWFVPAIGVVGYLFWATGRPRHASSSETESSNPTSSPT